MAFTGLLPAQHHRSLRRGAASVGDPADLVDLCRRLARSTNWAHLVEAGDRRWELLLRNADLDAWLIGWPPGTAAELHDHGSSSGALLVLKGSLVEMTPSAWGDGVVKISSRRVGAGQALTFGPGHVHDVHNELESAGSVSLHVYSPPLESMTYFDIERGDLVPRVTAELSSTSMTTRGRNLLPGEKAVVG